jgi:Ca2+-binding EF-hand superfamily protein
MRTLTAMVVILGLSGAAWAQEGKGDRERERKNKEATIGLKDIDTNNDGKAQVSELQAAISRLTGKSEGEKKKERREEGWIALKDVDTNNDGKASLQELQAALEKASKEGGEKKEGGDRKKKN